MTWLRRTMLKSHTKVTPEAVAASARSWRGGRSYQLRGGDRPISSGSILHNDTKGTKATVDGKTNVAFVAFRGTRFRLIACPCSLWAFIDVRCVGDRGSPTFQANTALLTPQTIILQQPAKCQPSPQALIQARPGLCVPSIGRPIVQHAAA